MVAKLVVVLPDKLRYEVESVFELGSKALALGFDDDYLQYLYSKESGRGFSDSCVNSTYYWCKCTHFLRHSDNKFRNLTFISAIGVKSEEWRIRSKSDGEHESYELHHQGMVDWKKTGEERSCFFEVTKWGG